MKYKEYNVFSTSKKTATVNNLEISSNKERLFDFSLLNEIEITDIEKNIIKQDAIKNLMFSNKISYYGSTIDQFAACDGVALYHVQKVYSEKTGKRLYGIFTLAKIKHYSKNRQSVYDNNYEVVETIKENGYNEPLTDIEI